MNMRSSWRNSEIGDTFPSLNLENISNDSPRNYQTYNLF